MKYRRLVKSLEKTDWWNQAKDNNKEKEGEEENILDC